MDKVETYYEGDKHVLKYFSDSCIKQLYLTEKKYNEIISSEDLFFTEVALVGENDLDAQVWMFPTYILAYDSNKPEYLQYSDKRKSVLIKLQWLGVLNAFTQNL